MGLRGGGTVGSAGGKEAARCKDAKRHRCEASIIKFFPLLGEGLRERVLLEDRKLGRYEARLFTVTTPFLPLLWKYKMMGNNQYPPQPYLTRFAINRYGFAFHPLQSERSLIREGASCHCEGAKLSVIADSAADPQSQDSEMLKHGGQSDVQDDTNPLPQSLPQGREVKRFSSRFTLHTSLKKTYRPNVLSPYRLKNKLSSLCTLHSSLKKRAAFTLAEGATHVAHSHNIRRVAFTLAEVLITLGIIGVVAAMTIPSIISDYVEKRTVVRVKSAYSVVSQAVLSAVAENGDVSNWCSSPMTDWDECTENIYKTLVPYFKSPILCTSSTDKRCGPITYKNSTGGTSNVTWISRILTNSEIIVTIEAYSGDKYSDEWCKATVAESMQGNSKNFFNSCGLVYVDINGSSGPNEAGRDLFIFKLFKDGIRPGGIPADTVWIESFEDQCLAKRPFRNDRAWCTGWVMYNENMDYLHCDDLSWDGKKSCK